MPNQRAERRADAPGSGAGPCLDSATGLATALAGPGDPAFRALIGDMTSALFRSSQDTSVQH